MTKQQITNFRQAQLEAEQRVLATGRLEPVEAYLDELDMAEDAKAALWLYAWSLLPPGRQSKEARSYLEAIEAVGGD